MTSRVLVVDDAPEILRTLTINLEARGYDVLSASDGSAALAAVEEQSPDIVVLDLGLPDMDGKTVIARLRAWTAVPILVLSGRHDGSEKVAALDLGADGYVTKPFTMEELVARLGAMLRRHQAAETEEPHDTITFGDVVVDLTAHRVTRAGTETRLTRTEWQLLEVLVHNPGRLLSHQQLLAEVWGPGYESALGNLRLYMTQLRRKLEADPAHPTHFCNEPGMGYRFQP